MIRNFRRLATVVDLDHVELVDEFTAARAAIARLEQANVDHDRQAVVDVHAARQRAVRATVTADNPLSVSLQEPPRPRMPPASTPTEGESRVLLKCHRGCETAAIVAELGMSLAELFDGPRQANGAGYTVTATYDYLDADGRLLYVVERRMPKDFRQRRPDGRGGWIWHLDDAPRVLYRLPEVIAAVAAGQTVYVVEGEKDVHAVEAAGAVATCNPGGAGKWRREYGDALRGAHVIVVADRDDAGREHAVDVAAKLTGTAADHLRAGRTLADLRDSDAYRRHTQKPQNPREHRSAEGSGDFEDAPLGVWQDEPIPLGTQPDPLPLGALGTVLRDLTVSVSEGDQVPTDMVINQALPGITTAAQSQWKIAVTADWAETLALDTITVGASGERKSAVYRIVIRPLLDIERAMQDAARPEIEKQRGRRNLAEDKAAQLRKDAVKAGDSTTADEMYLEALGERRRDDCRPTAEAAL